MQESLCYNPAMLTKTDPSVIQSYLEDSSNLQGGYADGLYLPENEKEVVEVLKGCSAKKTPLTVSGGTTGTTGGCIPFGGWILGCEKLNKIIKIDPEKQLAIVQPAVTLEALDRELKNIGFLYPPDPTETTAFLGGTIATNASGARSFKFGATRDWVNRLRMVLSSGKVIDIKRGEVIAHGQEIPNYQIPNVKTSAGYYSKAGMDLIDLFIGSEGTLGVVTEIEVALVPRFYDTFDIVAFFPTEEKAVGFVEEVKKREALTLEYFDKNSLELLRPSYQQIPDEAGAAVYLETEITPENEATYLDHWASQLEKHGVNLEAAWLGMNEKQKEDLRKFRHSMPEHINEEFKKHNTVKFASDIAVPDDRFREMLEFYNSHLPSLSPHLLWVKFGHIGQNHLHVNLVPKTQEAIPLAQETIMKFVKKGIELGGTCSAEHGIGKIKHTYLEEMYGGKGIREMVRIKKLFDPACILNQGNLFPKEYL
jgi:D-lactate dehydrogenase (cytochrome)